MIDLSAGARVHFVGIGGIGMSALAELVKRRGCEVSGTDRSPSSVIDRLVTLGITVATGHSAAAVGDADLVVYTPAVAPDNPELAEARRRKIPTMKRAELLGRLARGHPVVAVAGTHGKTTTTAMTGAVLDAAGMDPTVFVGGIVPGIERNLKVGAGDTWVLEADEFDRSFHQLKPHVAVVTSLEAEHLDTYGTVDAIVEAYEIFLGGIDGGCAVLNADAAAVRDLALPTGAARRTFGIEGGTLRAEAIQVDGLKTRFQAVEDGKPAAHLELQVPGRHNVMNALAAAAAARALGAAWPEIAEGLRRFAGVRRRFEVMGEAAGVTVISDYAHHPTEIAATLATAREHQKDRRVVILFQPHLYSRTRDLADDFGSVLSTADRVFVSEIYSAREAPIPGVNGAMIAGKVRDSGQPNVTSLPDLDAAVDAVYAEVQPGDLLLVVGAGDVERAAPAILDRLRG